MYIIYVDESGTPSFKGPKNDFHLAAFIISEQNYVNINQNVNEIKKRYFPEDDPEKVELHAGPMFKNLQDDKKWKIFDEIFELISEIDCKIISVIIRKERVTDKNTFDIEKWAYSLLIERIWKWIENTNKQASEKNYGILCIDSRDKKKDNQLRKKIRAIQKEGTYYHFSEYLIEDPFFVKSHFRNLAQLVDQVVYCIMRNHKKNKTKEDKEFVKLFSLIKSRIYANEKGEFRGYGIKIFPDD